VRRDLLVSLDFSIFHDGLIDGDRFIPFKFQTDDLTFTDAALIDGLFQLFSPDLPDPSRVSR
jgi:hypothetical protein